jgi:excisionase family DNA binding protein
MSHTDLAAERASLEAAGKNWEARHVADLIDLSELTVKRMARKGVIPAVKVGRKWEFPPAKVRAWYAGEPWEVSPPHKPRPRGPGKSK